MLLTLGELVDNGGAVRPVQSLCGRNIDLDFSVEVVLERTLFIEPDSPLLLIARHDDMEDAHLPILSDEVLLPQVQALDVRLRDLHGSQIWVIRGDEEVLVAVGFRHVLKVRVFDIDPVQVKERFLEAFLEA